MTLAVTGATGQLGRLAIDHLLTRGTPSSEIVALVRRPEAAADLVAKGVTVRHFDYNQPDALAAALVGVDSLLLVSGSEFGRRATQHQAVIDAAKVAGVGRIVYTSAVGPDASINPVAPEHKATEAALAASGVPHVILRNGWYHENFLGDLASAAQAGEIVTAAGEGRVASAPRSEYAEAAAVVLASGEVGRTYTLTGDVAWSLDELAADLAMVVGREVVARHVDAEAKSATLAGFGLDAGLVGFVVGVDLAIAAGELGVTNGELAGLIGRPTTPIVETLRAAA
ncbi:SDR family oxidoreductase [Propionicimonas sp.]|uniref:SDR family oxidoreductase n=1 Tax=Propionicimonas sp. TaxID=1955623 RepID=UPI0018560D58|nr:SDR family oxidoreductase [Propionicimonas sp.]MBU3975387.1 SDR family oxidoreductase [Actinomycetota bacterium]MBA3020207.1 SDR family oxidoreductase [Propionicimonas sp.]MBU3986464.1 SDR family oxidoreductase [Actinomycetota bacterium]MBU4008033.1 SDR family oxidoreductase [Actinomycetota bacterium]MBU4064291.1 SDR family oxidoreductase [Actinomycetota bacterium]